VPVRRRRARWRRAAPYAVAAVFGLAAVVGLAYPSASSARDRLVSARAAMEAGRASLLRGDGAAAEAAFGRAQAAFVRAGADARSPVLRAIGWIPVLGRTPETVSALADAGMLTAQGGAEVARALSSLPGGLESLSPQDGRFDAARLSPLAAAAGTAADRVASALALLRSSSGSMVLGPVASARTQALQQLGDLEHTLRTGADVLRTMPALLGSERPARYFFGAVSPSELRGSGGFLGAYSILTIDRGRIAFAPFRPTEDLRSFPAGTIAPPNADYARAYDRFGGADFWPNINMTPDFPSAALAIERLYERATDDRVDGVITADPFVLRALLSATGPVRVPALGRTLDAGTVVPYTANRAYSDFADQEQRKTALGSAAAAVFERFMGGAGDPVDAATALARTVSAGHLEVYSNDRDAEGALLRAGAAGAFRAPAGDFLALVQNNAAANKVDYYVTRGVSYSIQLGARGTGVATAQVQLDNAAPLTGASRYVLGPHRGISARGEDVSYTTLYCASSCGLEGAERDGRVEPQQVGRELGATSLQDYLRVPSRTSTTLSYRLNVGRAWSDAGTSGVYRLTFVNQATINPTRVRIDVQLPDGMRFTGANVPVDVTGGHVSWDGVPGRTLHLEIRFSEPLVRAAWHRTMDLLTRPIATAP